MKHRGFECNSANFDQRSGCWSGAVEDGDSVIYFESASKANLEQAFRAGIDDYLAFRSESDGQGEQMPVAVMALPLDPDLHHKAAARAAQEGVSINEWISRRIAEAA